MKLTLSSGAASEVFYNGKFYPTGKEIDMPLSEALRFNKTFRQQIREKIVPYDPFLFGEQKEIAMMADIDNQSGWGNVGLNLIKYSVDDVKTAQFGQLVGVVDKEVLEASRRGIEASMGLVIHEQPKEEWMTLPFERKIAIVPFETTRIPQSWVPRINSCKALIVPCKQNVEMMRDSGITIPIEIVHWGIDPEKFYEIERPRRDTFTFGTMGSLSLRKGTDILVKAFFEEFKYEKDVRLLCKTSSNNFLWAVRDPRMQVDMTPVSHEELMNLFFKQIDCFVFPTRGEGFGLTPLEAAATGVPIIATGWSGIKEYMTPEIGWEIDHTMEPATSFSEKVYKEPCGFWALPDKENLKKLMRYAYEHKNETKEKGKKAAEYVRREWTWKKKIPMYIDALKKHL
jgi:glycosyltransferase involved in cell wall biosynthesis